MALYKPDTYFQRDVQSWKEQGCKIDSLFYFYFLLPLFFRLSENVQRLLKTDQNWYYK